MEGKVIYSKVFDKWALRAVKVAEAHTGFSEDQLREVRERGVKKYFLIFENQGFHPWYNVDVEGENEDEVSYLVAEVPHAG